MILDIVIKASVVLALAAVAAIAMRRASASARHFVWSLGLAGALAAPLLSLALPRWQLPLFVVAAHPDAPASAVQSPSRPAQAPRLNLHRTTGGDERASAPRPAAAGPTAIATTRAGLLARVGTTPLLLSIWALGAAVILLRMLVGLGAVQVMSRRMRTADDASWMRLAEGLAADLGLARVRFLRSDVASMPMAWGILRPAVLMPADAETWPEDRLRIVLLHELAHVKRRDCLTHLFAQVACAAYWFNPLAWMAVRQLRSEREHACDDLVLAAGTRGSDYADQLLTIARVMRAGRFPALVAGASLAMAHRSQLEGRLMAILDPTVPRRALGRVRAALAAVTCALIIVPVAAVQPWAEAAAGPAADTGALDRLPAAQAAAKPSVASSVAESVTTSVTDSVNTATRTTTDSVTQGVVQGTVQGTLQGTVQGTVQGIAGAMAGVHVHVSAHPTPNPDPMPAFDFQNEKEKEKEKDKDMDSGGKGQRDPRAINALIEALKDSDKDVRETAMHALAQVRDPRVFEPLVLALRDSNAEVREQAAFGLGQMRDRRAIDPLMQTLTKDDNADVREQAAFALGQMHSVEAVDALTAGVRDKSADVRQQSVFALGQIRDQRAVDPLISALKDENADVREQAAFALGQLRNAKAIEPLVIALKDGNASVREQVAFALGQLRDPRAIDGLTLALKDSNSSVRQQAAFALGQIR